MRQPSKREIAKLERDAKNPDLWEEVPGFLNVSRPTSIRLSPTLIKNLERVAELRGERSYQTLLKKWVTERLEYEIELIDLARKKKTG